jgi:hypothetical protein
MCLHAHIECGSSWVQCPCRVKPKTIKLIFKQQSVGRHVASLRYIILIPSQPFFALSPLDCVLSGETTNINFIVFGLTRQGHWTHELPHSMWACKHITPMMLFKGFSSVEMRQLYNVSEWSNMSTHRLLFQWASTKNLAKHVGLVQSGHHYHLIKCNLFSPWYAWKIAHLNSNNNHSLFYHAIVWFFFSRNETTIIQ